MKRARKQHLPCPCGDSSDGYTEYENGGYCFPCKKKFREDGEVDYSMTTNEVALDTLTRPEKYSVQVVPYREHSISTLEKYGVKVHVTEDGSPFEVKYHYPTFNKYRSLLKKSFWTEGNHTPGLYGVDKFSAGESKYCTITEGEEDAHAVYEMLGSKFPVYSVQSSSSAVKDVSANKEYLDSFERIYLCLDNDHPGSVATSAIAALFPYQKVYYVKKTKHKDASDYQKAKETSEYRNLWFNAKRYDPENIVSSFSALEEIFSKPKKKAIASYPFKGLQDNTFGIRTGETVLFKALEGIGKTEVIGAIENHVLTVDKVPIGVIHLEEDIHRTVCRFVTYKVQAPVHIEELTDMSNADILSHFKEIVEEKDNMVSFYKPGRNDESPESFLEAIRFMVASAGCKIVFFDHISRLASTFKTDDERKMLDNVATRLSIMAEELDFALIEISHVNDDGLTRGSRNISKEAHIVVSLTRDKTSHDPSIRNMTNMVIEKNRPVSRTGPISPVFFDPVTFCLSDEPAVITALPPTGE